MLKATAEFLAEIDARSEARKKAIRTSVSEIVPVGRSYYVSKDGSDEADGLSPETAIGSFDKLNSLTLEPGDAVFFRRGDLWRINGYRIPAGVTLSAYGEGEKPILTCSPMNGADPALWTLLDGTDNIWMFRYELSDCGSLDMDGTFAYKEIPSYVNGQYVLRGDNSVVFDVKKHLTCDLAFFQPCDKEKNGAGNPNMTGTNKAVVYLRCDKGNPGSLFRSIEFLTGRHTLMIGGNSITIDNLNIRWCGAHGVSAGTVMELTVQNCEIGPLGGAIQHYSPNGVVTRFGNGVEIYGACYDYTLKNCFIHDIYDAGVTHQRKGNFANCKVDLTSAYVRPGQTAQRFVTDGVLVMEKVRYIGNLFERCIYSIEYFCDQDDSDDDIMRDILMEDNICRFAGGWGWQRPNKVARHIQGGWLGCKRKYHAEDYTIRNCVFDRSIDVLVSISSTRVSDLPKMEGNLYIAEKGANYGKYGVPYDRYEPYDETTEANIILPADPTAKVYLIG